MAMPSGRKRDLTFSRSCNKRKVPERIWNLENEGELLEAT